jgi:hypothetical protein
MATTAVVLAAKLPRTGSPMVISAGMVARRG